MPQPARPLPSGLTAASVRAGGTLKIALGVLAMDAVERVPESQLLGYRLSPRGERAPPLSGAAEPAGPG